MLLFSHTGLSHDIAERDDTLMALQLINMRKHNSGVASNTFDSTGSFQDRLLQGYRLPKQVGLAVDLMPRIVFIRPTLLYPKVKMILTPTLDLNQ
eukprot:5788335-Amphidinium_carterae.1